ncbi:hypothetical protein J6590_096857 [Homalodisca vitripennis]|nr:hypothetical protein J6590_096857 [Homalodisca vitripennis]
MPEASSCQRTVSPRMNDEAVYCRQELLCTSPAAKNRGSQSLGSGIFRDYGLEIPRSEDYGRLRKKRNEFKEIRILKKLCNVQKIGRMKVHNCFVNVFQTYPTKLSLLVK